MLAQCTDRAHKGWYVDSGRACTISGMPLGAMRLAEEYKYVDMDAFGGNRRMGSC